MNNNFSWTYGAVRAIYILITIPLCIYLPYMAIKTENIATGISVLIGCLVLLYFHITTIHKMEEGFDKKEKKE